jgi:hypothetical protein
MAAFYNWSNLGPQTEPAFVEEAFRDYFERASSAQALAHLDAYDLYFWEHRMPTWQSNVILESDCVFETMIVLNSRSALEKLVGVPLRERLANRTFKTVIRRTAPKLLDYPFNPDVWPPAAPKPKAGWRDLLHRAYAQTKAPASFRLLALVVGLAALVAMFGMYWVDAASLR